MWGLVIFFFTYTTLLTVSLGGQFTFSFFSFMPRKKTATPRITAIRKTMTNTTANPITALADDAPADDKPPTSLLWQVELREEIRTEHSLSTTVDPTSIFGPSPTHFSTDCSSWGTDCALVASRAPVNVMYLSSILSQLKLVLKILVSG